MDTLKGTNKAAMFTRTSEKYTVPNWNAPPYIQIYGSKNLDVGWCVLWTRVSELST